MHDNLPQLYTRTQHQYKPPMFPLCHHYLPGHQPLPLTANTWINQALPCQSLLLLPPDKSAEGPVELVFITLNQSSYANQPLIHLIIEL